jgi:hypothetical protein
VSRWLSTPEQLERGHRERDQQQDAWQPTAALVSAERDGVGMLPGSPWTLARRKPSRTVSARDAHHADRVSNASATANSERL